VEPVKIDYATPEPKPKRSALEVIWQAIYFGICSSVALCLSLMILLAFTVHRSNPADPPKAGIAVAAFFDLLFLVTAFRSLRKLVRQ